jgi:uncharacterized protein YrrD
MLRAVKSLHGSTIHALDGEIGKVSEILFDDEHWTVRYLIVETGTWLFGRKVLISPIALDHVKWEEYTLHCNLTREQIKNSPDVNTDQPVSRQWETDYYSYYGWSSYWGGMGGWGTYGYPGALFSQPFGIGGMSRMLPEKVDAHVEEHSDAHLRSSKEVTGYRIFATDEHFGHIADFIVDEVTWKIRYLAVNTGDWWPGKKVLMPPDWIVQVNWLDRSVLVDVSREQIKNAPEWHSDQLIDRGYEEQLYRYYVRQTPWEQEQVHEFAS